MNRHHHGYLPVCKSYTWRATRKPIKLTNYNKINSLIFSLKHHKLTQDIHRIKSMHVVCNHDNKTNNVTAYIQIRMQKENYLVTF